MCDGALLAERVSTLKLNWKSWPQDAAMPPLSRDSIHLWTLDLTAMDPDNLGRSVLQQDLDRGSRILDVEKRWLYLGGRHGMRLLLSRYTGLSPASLKFGYGNRGKPALLNELNGSELTFNYTLSRDKVLFAVSLDRQLGVDMEVLPRTINAELMAKRKLTASERQSWLGLPSDLSNDSMLCCWTRKEAYGKAIGVGVRFMLEQVGLFDGLDQCFWQTELVGLFERTDPGDMPALLEGVQLGLPFEAVASLMYEIENCQSDRPKLLAMQLDA
ncbi:MAG: 4'-phosphopantetheinyl transferase family protein [bacterium]